MRVRAVKGAVAPSMVATVPTAIMSVMMGEDGSAAVTGWGAGRWGGRGRGVCLFR